MMTDNEPIFVNFSLMITNKCQINPKIFLIFKIFSLNFLCYSI